MKKLKNRRLSIVLLSLLCTTMVCFACLLPQNEAHALSTGNSVTIGELLLDSDPTNLPDNDGLIFDGEQLTKLYDAMLGTTGTGTYDQVFALTKDANGGNVTVAGSSMCNGNLVVTIGGLEWNVVYLSTVDQSIGDGSANDGDIILTLWLANTTTTSTTDTEEFCGFANYYQIGSQNTDYPTNMYSTSSVRAVYLNNGGTYAYNSTTWGVNQAPAIGTATQSESSKYAKFTMESIGGSHNSLYDYIVAPENVHWQEVESVKDYIDPSGTVSIVKSSTGGIKTSDTGPFPNDAYGAVSAGASGVDFTAKPLYSAWKSDKIWLPSVTEVGNGDGTNGVWKCTNAQRANAASGYQNLRTGQVSDVCRPILLSQDGQFLDSTGPTRSAVRPAFHLNITKANEASTQYLTAPNTLSTVYDGTVKSISDADVIPYWMIMSEGTDYTLTNNFTGDMKNAGSYSYTVEITDTVHFAWRDTTDPQTDTKRNFTFTVKKKGVTAPQINDNTQTYNGTEFDFYFNGSYNPSLMEVARPTGITFDSSTNTYSDGLFYNDSEKRFSATNAGVYSVLVKLKDANNYAWGADGSTDTAQKTLTITINKKELSISATPSDTSLSWKKKEAGTITVTTPNLCTGDTVSLYVFYVNSTGVDYHSPAVTGHVLDVSKISATGTYTLCAKIIQDGETDYSADNANYVISSNGGVWEMPSTFKITASGIDADDLTWYYEKTGDSWSSPLFGSDGTQVKLEYSSNLYYKVTAEGNSNVETFAYNGDGFVNGYKTLDADGNPVTGGECKAVGTYTTYVAVKITNTTEFAFDSEHILDGNPQYGWLSYEWEISPRELDFADAEWEYTTDGGTNWTAFMQDGVQVDPEYTGLPILIRISPDYISSLGLDPDADITITYLANSKKDKETYTATATIEISNPSFCTPDTSDGSDYAIDFTWSITNKKIQIKNWSGSQTVTLSDGRAFSVPAIVTSDGRDYSSYLTYTYECVVDGQTRTATSLEALKAILESANVSDSNPLTVNISVEVKSTQQNSFTLAGNSSTTCELGDSKEVINVWLEYETSEYGNVQFILHAEDKDGVDYLQYIKVTLSSVLLPDPVDPVQGSNYSALVQYLTKTGTYSLSFELDDLYATGFLLDPTTLTFEITPKQVYIPTVNKEIVFTGENISLINYLDGYDPSIMTIDALDKRDAGTVYTATITLTDVLNYVFVMRPAESSPAEPTKKAVRYTLTGYENSTEFANDEHTAALLKWQINPYVLDSSLWNLKGSNGAVLNLPAQFAAMLSNGTLDLSVGYRYYEDAAGGVIDPEFKPGNTFYVDAFLEGADAGNFVFENGTIVSDKVTYSVPKSGITAIMSNVKDFVTKTWLGLPIWAWLLIGLFLLILLIIIIVVACKRRKSKEERAEAKARKEEERQLQREKLEAERELAKAKQEAELEKIRAQAGLAAGAGMASMSMQQAQPQPQQMQQPVQTAHQSQPQTVQYASDSSALAEIRAELAEIRARQNAVAVYAQPPMQQTPMQYMNDPVAAAELIRLKAENEAHLRAELERSRSETERARAEAEIAKVRAENSRFAPFAPQYDAMKFGIGNDMEKIGALAVAIWKSMNSAQSPAELKSADLPQIAEESASVQTAHAVYPPDSVVTTTTTVDTTKGKPIVRKRDEDGNFDIDGFYDNADF